MGIFWNCILLAVLAALVSFHASPAFRKARKRYSYKIPWKIILVQTMLVFPPVAVFWAVAGYLSGAVPVLMGCYVALSFVATIILVEKVRIKKIGGAYKLLHENWMAAFHPAWLLFAIMGAGGYHLVNGWMLLLSVLVTIGICHIAIQRFGTPRREEGKYPNLHIA
jgi:hypothetical protein